MFTNLNEIKKVKKRITKAALSILEEEVFCFTRVDIDICDVKFDFINTIEFSLKLYSKEDSSEIFSKSYIVKIADEYIWIDELDCELVRTHFLIHLIEDKLFEDICTTFNEKDL